MFDVLACENVLMWQSCKVQSLFANVKYQHGQT